MEQADEDRTLGDDNDDVLLRHYDDELSIGSVSMHGRRIFARPHLVAIATAVGCICLSFHHSIDP